MMGRLMRRGICLGVIAVLAGAAMATAQNVALDNGAVQIFDTDGVQTWVATNGADVDAGGDGRNADLTLRNIDGAILFSYGGGTGDLVLGGGTQDGDIILRDTDGTTTTINMQGSSGFIQLGSNDEDGDLQLFDNSPDNPLSINLNGATGNVSNQFAGNGVVKGWARITAAGAVASCYNCDVGQTNGFGSGQYEVDFTPIGADITSRPWVCSVGNGTQSVFPRVDQIGCVGRAGDPSSVFVEIENDAGTNVDRDFTIVVF